MPSCGSQCTKCYYPIHFDTYRGCSHGCAYCFARRKNDIAIVKAGEGLKALKAFCEGKRSAETNWCDWRIPFHWGGNSDPFQPAEAEMQISLACLRYLAETGYPFIVSTKGKLVSAEPYRALLAQCNAVVQVSAVCPSYDHLEPGAPSFEERLKMARALTEAGVRRVILRAQPYMHEVREEILAHIPRMAETGAHGVIFEGMKFIKAKPGLVKVAGNHVYPKRVLESDWMAMKEACHRAGLQFYSGENRLRMTGDSFLCCGTEGLDDFVPNTFHVGHIMAGFRPEPTEAQMRDGTAGCFCRLHQSTLEGRIFRTVSFKDATEYEARKKPEYYRRVFGFSEEEK